MPMAHGIRSAEHWLDQSIPLPPGVSSVRCVVAQKKGRLAMRAEMLDPLGRVIVTYHARHSGPVWRGLVLPSMRHFCAHLGLTLEVREVLFQTDAASSPEGPDAD